MSACLLWPRSVSAQLARGRGAWRGLVGEGEGRTGALVARHLGRLIRYMRGKSGPSGRWWLTLSLSDSNQRGAPTQANALRTCIARKAKARAHLQRIACPGDQ